MAKIFQMEERVMIWRSKLPRTYDFPQIFWSSDDPSPPLGPQLQPDATAASLWPSAVTASASLGDCRRWSQPNDPIGWSSWFFPRAKLDDMDIYIYIYMVTSCKIDRTCVLWRGTLVSGIDFPLYITLWLFNMMIYLLPILIFHGYVNPTINH